MHQRPFLTMYITTSLYAIAYCWNKDLVAAKQIQVHKIIKLILKPHQNELFQSLNGGASDLVKHILELSVEHWFK